MDGFTPPSNRKWLNRPSWSSLNKIDLPDGCVGSCWTCGPWNELEGSALSPQQTTSKFFCVQERPRSPQRGFFHFAIVVRGLNWVLINARESDVRFQGDTVAKVESC